LASSEGSPPLSYSWEVFYEGLLSLKTTLGSREVGLGEEQVSSLRGWGDVPMREFLEQPLTFWREIPKGISSRWRGA